MTKATVGRLASRLRPGETTDSKEIGSLAMRVKVLLRTSRASLPAALAERLGTNDYEWMTGVSEDGLLSHVRRHEPDVLVFERAPGESVDELQLTRIRHMNPDIKVLCVSAQSSSVDAEIVEQGVFYYTVAPETEELEQVISEAAAAVRRRRRSSGALGETSQNDRRNES